MSDELKIKLRSKRINVLLEQEDVKIDVEEHEDTEKKDARTLFFEQQIKQKYEEGFSEGYNKAKSELEEQFANEISGLTEQFQGVLNEIDIQLQGYDKIFEPLVLETAIEIAKKIIKKNISEESIIESTLREALRKIIGANQLVIKVCQNDYDIINNYTSLPAEIENFNKIRFEIDDAIELGGCLVETDLGNIDARIITQIEELVSTIRAKILNLLD